MWISEGISLFYEKWYEHIFTQLSLWYDILQLTRACMKPKFTLPYIFLIHNLFQISETSIFWDSGMIFGFWGHRHLCSIWCFKKLLTSRTNCHYKRTVRVRMLKFWILVESIFLKPKVSTFDLFLFCILLIYFWHFRLKVSDLTHWSLVTHICMVI